MWETEKKKLVEQFQRNFEAGWDWDAWWNTAVMFGIHSGDISKYGSAELKEWYYSNFSYGFKKLMRKVKA